ncbi:MAG TPA: glycosyltransferase family 4 protein [Thermoanaerobaculia bacterium]|nr:glycosyltransferase family 4 protein [Thermoanaerobaculia bacterium]
MSHPPLVAELGASQLALQLAEGLRTLGHDALAWSPSPLPAGTRWWNVSASQRQRIERFAAEHGPFDLIDTPAITASARLARSGPLVVRSVQPELLYLLHGVREDLRRPLPSPRVLAHTAVAVRQAADIVAGWRRARAIVCLGGHELAWMRRRFPAWTAKTTSYVIAPPPAERHDLAEVRRKRPDHPPGPGTRFLWIGRWAAHKGTRTLLDFLTARLGTHPDDVVTIAGCGPAAELEIQAEWLRTGRVRLLPSFTRAGLPPLLASHDAGLFTSSVEGWGLILNEMLESGLPVYATEAGGVTDLRPYFPRSLRPFPPPPRIEPAPLEDLRANGYFQRFDWSAITREYERQVLSPMAGSHHA